MSKLSLKGVLISDLLRVTQLMAEPALDSISLCYPSVASPIPQDDFCDISLAELARPIPLPSKAKKDEIWGSTDIAL